MSLLNGFMHLCTFIDFGGSFFFFFFSFFFFFFFFFSSSSLSENSLYGDNKVGVSCVFFSVVFIKLLATDVAGFLSSRLQLLTIHLKFSTILVPKYCDST